MQENLELFACTGCHSVLYCSRDCQREAWPQHRARCQKVREGIDSVMRNNYRFVRRCTETEAKEAAMVLPKCANIVYATFLRFVAAAGIECTIRFHECNPPCSGEARLTSIAGPGTCSRCGTLPLHPEHHKATCDDICSWVDGYVQKGWRHLVVGAQFTGTPLSCTPIFITTHEFEKPDGAKVVIRYHKCSQCSLFEHRM
jgi:hypothetical protein